MTRFGLMNWLGLVAGLIASTARADDWPQWQGPTRDSVWRETRITDSLEGKLDVRWRAKVSGGYSGPAVAAGRVYITDYVRTAGEPKNDPGGRPQLQGEERVLCLDATSGQLLWKHAYPRPYEISYPAGPRATPAVDGDRVYTLGAEGNLLCLQAATGQVVWHVDLKARYQAPTPIWGFCSHPLIDGDKLFVLAGGAGSVVVALDKRTGQELWRALSAPDAGYCPPTLIHTAQGKQLVVWHPLAVNGLRSDTGEVLWSVKLEPNYGMSINPPCQIGEHLFVAGIVNQGVLLKLAQDQPTVSEVWRVSSKLGFAPVHSPVVPLNNTLYGVDRMGELAAIEIPSGKKLWETYQATTGERRANSGTAFIVRNDERFFIFNERGDLIIARLSPKGYEELSRAHLLEPTHEAFGRNVVWSHPAYANRCVFARNDQELICVGLESK